MIEGLQEMEAGFQLEGLMFLAKRLMRNVRNFSFLLKQMESLVEFGNGYRPPSEGGDPSVISFLQRATDMLSELNLEESKRIGPWGMATALFDDEINDGLGALLQITKAAGKMRASFAETPAER